jgi:hypothetical protein
MTGYGLQGEPYMVIKAMEAEAENILKVRPITGMQRFSQQGHCPSLSRPQLRGKGNIQ